MLFHCEPEDESEKAQVAFLNKFLEKNQEILVNSVKAHILNCIQDLAIDQWLKE